MTNRYVTLVAVLQTGFLIALAVCHSGNSGDAVARQGAELDRALTEAYLQRDWRALSGLVAPEYYGAGQGFEWDSAALQREFPKIHLSEFHLERQRVKSLSPDLILVNDTFTIRETYAGRDISGRYWSSDIWVRRGGRWLLLVEQELPLP